jgi:arylsulfatase
MIRWPSKVQSGTSDEIMHVVDWFPTLMNLIGHEEAIPTDRVLDGVDQSAFLTGEQEHSNRDYFHMFFDQLHVGMKYKNFKILTHKIEDGAAPIQKLATPHVYNLNVDPGETTPYNYSEVSSWLVFRIFPAKTMELRESLEKDSVPFMAPLDFNPYDKQNGA